MGEPSCPTESSPWKDEHPSEKLDREGPVAVWQADEQTPDEKDRRYAARDGPELIPHVGDRP